MPDLMISGPEDAAWTFLLAHGAGAGMETPFLARISELLAERGLRVARFEFSYMAGRRNGGKRRPPPKAETLMPEYRAAVAAVRADDSRGRLAIGGKSMGGRVASMVADELFDTGAVGALVCLGYPFHPPGMPEKIRTAHLTALSCPTMIIQGERDPFGNRAEVSAYDLSGQIEVFWSTDGDHDLGPRGASGYTRKGNLMAAADAVATFLRAHE